MGAIKLFHFVEGIFLNITQENCLLDVPAFMKQYFFEPFLDKAETELLEEVMYISRGGIQNWMTMNRNDGGDVDPPSNAYRNGTALSNTNENMHNMIVSLEGDFTTQSIVNHLDSLHITSSGIHRHDPKMTSRHVYGGAGWGTSGSPASSVLCWIFTTYCFLFRSPSPIIIIPFPNLHPPFMTATS